MKAHSHDTGRNPCPHLLPLPQKSTLWGFLLLPTFGLSAESYSNWRSSSRVRPFGLFYSNFIESFVFGLTWILFCGFEGWVCAFFSCGCLWFDFWVYVFVLEGERWCLASGKMGLFSGIFMGVVFGIALMAGWARMMRYRSAKRVAKVCAMMVFVFSSFMLWLLLSWFMFERWWGFYELGSVGKKCWWIENITVGEFFNFVINREKCWWIENKIWVNIIGFMGVSIITGRF